MPNEKRLAVLATTPRVWPHLSVENVTPGLIELCRDWITPDMVLVEIGCFSGVSTEVFANFAKTVYAVDPWTLAIDTGYREVDPDMLVKAERAFLEMAKGYQNIVRIQDFSGYASESFGNGTLDAVYIDGDHSKESLATDFASWLPKLKRTGLLMGHDWS